MNAGGGHPRGPGPLRWCSSCSVPFPRPLTPGVCTRAGVPGGQSSRLGLGDAAHKRQHGGRWPGAGLQPCWGGSGTGLVAGRNHSVRNAESAHSILFNAVYKIVFVYRINCSRRPERLRAGGEVPRAWGGASRRLRGGGRSGRARGGGACAGQGVRSQSRRAPSGASEQAQRPVPVPQLGQQLASPRQGLAEPLPRTLDALLQLLQLAGTGRARGQHSW